MRQHRRLKLGEEKKLKPVYESKKGAFGCPDGCGYRPAQLLPLMPFEKKLLP